MADGSEKLEYAARPVSSGRGVLWRVVVIVLLLLLLLTAIWLAGELFA